ncbi:hypothetical protein [Catellatospora sp. NPDC049609]|uniref:hypothetical protein n=1 Tax=Catellatospora sp. NPDC049609 TaxID=3155505 RepID=UPI00343A35BC
MTVFVCAGCGAPLTPPLSQVALPDHAHQQYGYGLLGVLMDPGTYAVEPEPSGQPWLPWAEVGADAAADQGVYAPVYTVSGGPRRAVVIAPGDIRGTVFIPGRLDGYCCGLDGRDGPNMACDRCGLPVASRTDDCGLWQTVWLDPRAVDPVTDGAPAHRTLDWHDLLRERPGIPPIEQGGYWSPVWSAAAGATLAHLLAASAGTQVTVPGGLVATVFRRALDAILPPGPPVRSLTLAGPGLPATVADIALVPRHPQTGERWTPPEAVDVVPLSWDVWAQLACPRDLRVPGAGELPTGILRDDPLPLLPYWHFTPDEAVFAATLARLPAVRQPWLRDFYDRRCHPPLRLFW